MKNLDEMRDAAWKALWQEKWLSRFAFLIVGFGLIRYIVVNFAVSMLDSANSVSERLMAAETPIDVFALFNDASFMRAFAAITSLSLFLAAVINAIAEFGLSRVRLAVAEKRQVESWQKEAFSGVHDPLGLFTLSFLHGILISWPFFLVIIPCFLISFGNDAPQAFPYHLASLPSAAFSLVAFYRYRQAWFLKAAHPDWSAVKCLRTSSKMMHGYKWRNFKFDCTFWRPITLMMLTAFAACVFMLIGAPAFPMLLCAVTISGLHLYLSAYMPLGQAFFHLELPKTVEDGDET